MKKFSVKELSSLFDDIQISLNKFKNQIKNENISNTTQQQLKDLNDSIKSVGMSIHGSLYEMDQNNKKTFNMFKRMNKDIDNYLQHLSVLGGSVSQFTFAQYKVLNDYTSIFDGINAALSAVYHKISDKRKSIDEKLNTIDTKINKYIILGDKYVNNIGKLQKQGDKLTTKQINKLNERLQLIEQEENKLNERKTQLAKRVGDQLQEQQLSSQFEQLNKQKQIIQQQLQEEQEKRQKYVQYSVGYNEKFSQEQLNRYQQIFSENIKENNDKANDIQKQISELVKIQYDENISNKKRNEQLDEIEQLNKKKQYLEKQNLELQKKIEKLENISPSKSSYFNFLNPITKMLSYQFNKKSPIMRVFSGLSSIWKVFTKGIKILTKLPELLSPIYWLFKIGTIVAGFITLMVASPTFRRLVKEGIFKLGDLLKDQFIQIGKNAQKGLKWLVWDEPIHLIDEYITKPLQKGIKSLQNTIKYAVWEEPINLINKYIVTPLQIGIQGWYNNVKDFITSIPDNIKTQFDKIKDGVSDWYNNVKDFITSIPNNIKTSWNKISGGIKDQFTGIYNIITKNPITDFIKDTWDKISGQIHNIFGYIKYIITHPLHFKSYSEYLKDLQPKEQKPPSLKQYPVENPNNPLISGKNNIQSTISQQTNNLKPNIEQQEKNIDYQKLGIELQMIQSMKDLNAQEIQLGQIQKQLLSKEEYNALNGKINLQKGISSDNNLNTNYNITPEQNSTALPLHKQKGGLVTGPGSDTDDKILTQLSNGEYVVPQNIVKQYPILMSTIEQLRQGTSINTIIQPVKMVIDNMMSSTKSLIYNIKDKFIDLKDNAIKDLIQGRFDKLISDIKNSFTGIKGSFMKLISNFKDIIPEIKGQFKNVAKNFMNQANSIANNIKSIGGIASSLGFSSIGKILTNIAPGLGIAFEGYKVIKGATDWIGHTFLDPIGRWLHEHFPHWWQDPDKTKNIPFQNGGLVPGGYSQFDNINAKLQSGEYVIPNYITSNFPSLIKNIEDLRISMQPHNIQNTSINSLLYNDNPLSKLVNISDNNFNKLNNILDKLVKNKQEQPSNIIQSTNVQSNTVNTSNNYDLILGDISV